MLVIYSYRNPSVIDFVEWKAKSINNWSDLHWHFIAAAIYLGRDDDELWEIVKKGILSPFLWRINYAQIAIRAIARRHKEGPETLQFLKKICVLKRGHDDYIDTEIRIAAIRQLAREWKDDSETYSFLKHRFSVDSEPSVRAQILIDVMKFWHLDIGEASEWVTKALNNQHEELRALAPDYLPKVMGKNLEVFNVLANLAENDSDPWVRISAIINLNEVFPGEEKTLAILQKRAVKDRRGEVRKAAIKELFKYTAGDGELLKLLKERTEKDRHSEVREIALLGFCHYAKNTSECLLLLKHVAQNDRQSNVCNVALKLIVSFSDNDNETLQILARTAQDQHRYGSQALALELFLSYNKDPRFAISVLKSVVLNSDLGSDLRVLAIQELVKLKDEDSDIYYYIKKLVDIEVALDIDDLDDVAQVDQWVSVAALKALAIGWKKVDEVKHLIMGILAIDNSTRVYNEALEVLVDEWGEDLDAQALIVNKIVSSAKSPRFNDDFNQLSNRSNTDGLIYSRMTEMFRDKRFETSFKFDKEVRVKALHRIISNWMIDIDMLTWLKTNAEAYGEKGWQLANLKEIYERWPDNSDISIFGLQVLARLKTDSEKLERMDSDEKLLMSNDLSFAIANSEKCEDIDGNVYNAVSIGGQIWMAEHLKVSRYRNGDSILHARRDEWQSASINKIGACCFSNDDPITNYELGRLYNWYAVNDPRGLAPIGWHVATDQDWKKLELNLGMNPDEIDEEHDLRGIDQQIGRRLEPLFEFWKEIDFKGFNALPAGFRRDDDDCDFDQSSWCYIWTSSDAGSDIAWQRTLFFQESAGISRLSLHKAYGMSIRCVKDSL